VEFLKEWGKTFEEAGGEGRGLILGGIGTGLTTAYKGVNYLFHNNQWRETLMDIHSWVAAISLGLFGVAITVIIWLFRYATKLRIEKIPKIRISDPIETKNPKSATGKCGRMFSISIENISEAKLTNVQVKQQSFVNGYGEQSDSNGHRFRRNNERGALGSDFEHSQSFDIAPRDSETVDIVALQEDSAENPLLVVMLYARKGNQVEIRNGIPFDFFPHVLIVRVSADNLAAPMEKTFRIYLTRDGILNMEAL
jgi:hypothetical protein